MAEIEELLEIRLRSAAPDFVLLPGFTERVMQQTVYRPTRASQVGYHFQQLRIAGMSMILAGFLIMVSNTIPLSHDLDRFKTSLYTAADQMPWGQLPWVDYQYSKSKGR